MSIWYKVAGVSGASAVGAAAYGAHGYKPEDPYYTKVYQNANSFHLLHSVMIGMAPLTRRPNVIGGMFASGTALFSGSCYAAALSQDKANGKLAPVGGSTLIAAWLALAALA
mmetsp:Transcript_37072/g.80727  ORF Transcript_37072/g.80727 Transcript_37072/m.80727 type:complete len:112 (-) Transcript_37072:166-501(-)|eukprot:CAMPEP_0118921946 /NCGR_PEP_ID=MMETSP1169-20130426/1060_1 /TAXON_ID=36882 /ORGANISM="Pyramimonas obovata, Strain CCMP722" /LENGTH=111 /DNA_ID=CAMNT_0006862753 /DNA_START=79 /DNA_END=414 /DNA_ORIENTATION=+